MRPYLENHHLGGQSARAPVPEDRWCRGRSGCPIGRWAAFVRTGEIEKPLSNVCIGPLSGLLACAIFRTSDTVLSGTTFALVLGVVCHGPVTEIGVVQRLMERHVSARESW